jgi:hypothetical protein
VECWVEVVKAGFCTWLVVDEECCSVPCYEQVGYCWVLKWQWECHC